MSLFQISDLKPEFLLVELKVCKNGIFWAKNEFQKNFPRLFLSPNQTYVKKNWVKMASKLVFIGGAESAHPPATWDAFQMLPLVGLKKFDLIFQFNIFGSTKTFHLWIHVMERQSPIISS